jgi:hypothetical protein
MVAPLVGLAVGAAARLVAKKAAQEAAKKAAKKAAAKVAERSSVKVSSNVKVIPGKMSPTSVRASSVNEKLISGADKARSQNATTKSSSTARANKRAVKSANKNVAIKYKKGFNESNYSGRNESIPKQVAKSKVRGNGNPKAPMTQPSSYKEAKSAYNAYLKKNPEVAKKVDPNPKFAPRISRSAKENKKLNKNKNFN